MFIFTLERLKLSECIREESYSLKISRYHWDNVCVMFFFSLNWRVYELTGCSQPFDKHDDEYSTHGLSNWASVGKCDCLRVFIYECIFHTETHSTPSSNINRRATHTHTHEPHDVQPLNSLLRYTAFHVNKRWRDKHRWFNLILLCEMLFYSVCMVFPFLNCYNCSLSMVYCLSFPRNSNTFFYNLTTLCLIDSAESFLLVCVR